MRKPPPIDRQDKDSSTLSDEDRALFRAETKDVRRMKTDRAFDLPPRSVTVKISRPTPPDLPFAIDPIDGLPSDQQLFFNRGGVQKNILSRLKRGLIPPEDSLDLHGLNREHATMALARFIDRALANGRRYICVVHGKGYGSGSGLSILKAVVDSELRQRREVLAFLSAPEQNGGTGAVLVILKRR